MNSCDTKTGTCESATTPSCQGTSKCGCGGVCGGDPAVCKMHKWMCAFNEAKRSVQVEILKAKIQKSWGPRLEKEASAVIEAMEAKWKATQAEGQVKEQLIERFDQICKECK